MIREKGLDVWSFSQGARGGVGFGDRGSALIEVLIAAGMMVSVVLAIASLLVQVQKQNKALTQKLDVVHLDQQISRFLTNPTSCGCMFQNMRLTGTSIDVSPLKAGCPVTTAPNLAAVGQPLNTASSVKVASVRLNNIQTVSSSVKTADLEITFDQSNLVIPLKNVTLNGILFQVNADQTIASCGGSTTTKGTCENLGGTWNGSECTFKGGVIGGVLYGIGSWPSTTLTVQSHWGVGSSDGTCSRGSKKFVSSSSGEVCGFGGDGGADNCSMQTVQAVYFCIE